MKYISLFSGIGGFDLALERAGFTCDTVCEIDKHCQGVLKRHFPGARIIDDVKMIGKDTHERGSIDLICGGFPCQDLSVAGKRAGLVGERSGLWFEFARIIDELEPRWVVIENVPGLLSSNRGRDFAVIIQWLAKRGYGVAWRVLDAQYFGVPQRRRRVFIVGSLGSGCASEVLFEREGGAGNIAPSRKAGQRAANDAPASTLRGFGHGWQGQHNDTNAVMAFGGNNTSGEIDVATAVNAAPTRRYDFESETFVAYNIQHNDGGEHKRKDRPNGGLYVSETDTALTVGSTDLTAIAWQNHQQSGEIRIQDDNVPTLSRNIGTGGNNVPFVGVRRLTPTECERLQGFPDGWTDNQSDSARYRQLGNAVAVPVIEWIAKRIASI